MISIPVRHGDITFEEFLEASATVVGGKDDKDRLLWANNVCVRSLKVRRQPWHQ